MHPNKAVRLKVFNIFGVSNLDWNFIALGTVLAGVTESLCAKTCIPLWKVKDAPCQLSSPTMQLDLAAPGLFDRHPSNILFVMLLLPLLEPERHRR